MATKHLFSEQLSEALAQKLSPTMARKQPTTDERIKRLYGLIRDTENRLKRAPPSEKAIIQVGLDALHKELSRVSKPGRRDS